MGRTLLQFVFGYSKKINQFTMGEKNVRNKLEDISRDKIIANYIKTTV